MASLYALRGLRDLMAPGGTVSDLRQIVADLVAIPSINPMGRGLDGPEFFEAGVTAYLEEFFRKLGVPYERQKVADGRENIFARIDCVAGAKRSVPRTGARPVGLSPGHTRGQIKGGGSASVVLLEAHQDTVPADGMVIEPFQPLIKDGRMYGRGACDIKGGMAAMLGAFARMARERPSDAASVVMACTVDEEFGFTGIRELTRLWTQQAGGPDSLLASRPDMAIVAEPTNLQIVVAHKGAVRWKIAARGRACHSSRPEDGVNAIYRMARIISALERYAEQVPKLAPEHPLCGRATLNVGRIEGGISTNTVPDECDIEIDRRTLPGEDAMQARQAVEDFLRRQPEIDFDFDMHEPWMRGHALSHDTNAELAERLGRVVDEVHGRHRKIGVPYGTNAATLAEAGVPAVVFGPGSIQQAHTADEWLPLDELEQASEILYRFISQAE